MACTSLRPTGAFIFGWSEVRLMRSLATDTAPCERFLVNSGGLRGEHYFCLPLSGLLGLAATGWSLLSFGGKMEPDWEHNRRPPAEYSASAWDEDGRRADMPHAGPLIDGGTSIGSSRDGRAFRATSDQDRAYSAARVDRDRKSRSSTRARSRLPPPDRPPRRQRQRPVWRIGKQKLWRGSRRLPIRSVSRSSLVNFQRNEPSEQISDLSWQRLCQDWTVAGFQATTDFGQ
jgi:hypothetical protein